MKQMTTTHGEREEEKRKDSVSILSIRHIITLLVALVVEVILVALEAIRLEVEHQEVFKPVVLTSVNWKE